MIRSCTTCKHDRPSIIYGDACYRSKTFVSGRVLTAPRGIGFNNIFETGHPDIYEGRADLDNCGLDRRHWLEK